MVEGPRIARRQEESLEDVVEITKLHVGQKVIVWEDFASDSEKPMWLATGDIGNVTTVDGDGDALIAFAGKDKGGKSLSTIIKWKNFGKLRCQAAPKAAAKPRGPAPAPPAAAAPAAARPRRIITCGDVMGNVGKLFAMVEAQTSKVGPFDAVLCVGAFLPPPGSDAEAASGLAPFLAGGRRAPAPTYFVDSSPALLQAAPRGRKLGEDLHFLGGYGTRRIGGLQVAFLSGRYDPSVYETPDADFVGGAFTCRAVAELRRLVMEHPGRLGIDVLLTCGWPSDLEQRLKPEEPVPVDPDDSRPSWQLSCAPPVRDLCLALEPRYHLFGTADVFYSRPPFQTPNKGHISRLVGLGRVGSSMKQRKWLHALSLSPMEEMRREDLKQLPPNATPNPFLSSKKRPPPAPAAGEPGAKRPRAPETEEAALREEAEKVLAAGDVMALGTLGERLATAPIRAGFAEGSEAALPPKPKRPAAKAPAAAAAPAAAPAPEAPRAEAPAPAAAGGGGKEEETEVVLTDEEIAKREAAKTWLRKDPKQGTVRYTFKEDGPLGLRFSKDVPPWILEVRDGSLAAKKAPRVPVAGIVIAVNGYELCEKDCEEALQALKKRPVVLDVEWPCDQGTPTVKRA